MRAAAFSVHIFTALGAGVALIAMLEAVREHWTSMFAWLGVALIIDAIQWRRGPLGTVYRLPPDEALKVAERRLADVEAQLTQEAEAHRQAEARAAELAAELERLKSKRE